MFLTNLEFYIYGLASSGLLFLFWSLLGVSSLVLVYSKFLEDFYDKVWKKNLNMIVSIFISNLSLKEPFRLDISGVLFLNYISFVLLNFFLSLIPYQISLKSKTHDKVRNFLATQLLTESINEKHTLKLKKKRIFALKIKSQLFRGWLIGTWQDLYWLGVDETWSLMIFGKLMITNFPNSKQKESRTNGFVGPMSKLKINFEIIKKEICFTFFLLKDMRLS